MSLPMLGMQIYVIFAYINTSIFVHTYKHRCTLRMFIKKFSMSLGA